MRAKIITSWTLSIALVSLCGCAEMLLLFLVQGRSVLVGKESNSEDLCVKIALLVTVDSSHMV